MIPGTLILDANAIWRLEDPDVQERVLRSLRAAHLAFRPTAINVLEVARIRNRDRRTRLFRTLRILAAGSAVRPFPSEILALTGRAMAAGAERFRFPPSGYEWMLYKSEHISERHVEDAARHLEEAQAAFDEMQRTGRRALRAFLQQTGVRDPWGDIPTFLDTQWTTAKHLDTYIERTWTGLGIPGKPDVERVMANEAWRLYHEGMGASVYERAVLSQSPSPIDLADISQLVYLAGNHRRILVSDDNDLVRVGNAVLIGRYRGSRILRVSEFLDLAS